MTPSNRQIYGLMAGLQPDSSIAAHNNVVQHKLANRNTLPGGPVIRSPAPAMPAPKTGPTAASPQAANSYQSGLNANGQAINSGSIIGRMAKESGSPSPFRGASDLRASLLANNQAQVARGIAGENSQQYMNNQIARSELTQSALSNMAQMYQDMSKRNVDQQSLATQLQQAIINSRNSLGLALTQI